MTTTQEQRGPYVAPSSIAEAQERSVALLQSIQEIEADVSSRSWEDFESRDHFYRWKRNALRAKAHKTAEYKQLKDWLAEARRKAHDSDPNRMPRLTREDIQMVEDLYYMAEDAPLHDEVEKETLRQAHAWLAAKGVFDE